MKIGILSQLPPELAYLAEPAMRYGVYHFDNEMDAFLSSAPQAAMEELSGLAARVRSNNHFPKVNEWLDRFCMTQYAEAANLYFMFGLMDMAGLEFD
jgi:hypothetical protein